MNVTNADSGTRNFDLSTLSEQASCSLEGSSGAEVAMLLVQTARDERDQSQVERQGEEKRLAALEAEQVDCLLREADAVRAAGQMRALGLMASGGFTLAGAGLGLDAGGSSGALLSEGAKGAGDLVQGGANLFAAEYDFEAKVAEADGARAENASHQSERRMNDLSAAASDSSDVARDALEAASSLVQAEVSANQATLYLRG